MQYEWGNVREQVNKHEYEENTTCSSSIYLGNIHDVGGVETESNLETFRMEKSKGWGGSRRRLNTRGSRRWVEEISVASTKISLDAFNQ